MIAWLALLVPLATAVLLERYYDPLYRHSESRHDYRARFDATDPAAAAAAIVAWIERHRSARG